MSNIDDTEYVARLKQQTEQYIDVEIHDLPKIFHYWSRHLTSILEEPFGTASVSGVYAEEFARAIERTGNHALVSLGAGDGGTEVEVAMALRRLGVRKFSIELVEVSEHLLERAVKNIAEAGLDGVIRITHADINVWRPKRRYAGVMANHSLHHFQRLESIFDAIWEALEKDGAFVSFDMIGRNGHQRWPESLILTQFFWDQLPERYKYHRQLKRLESPWFMDWDCSAEGFEGIRAQDILPLLVQKFGFRKFAAWGGLIDVFVDRGFGPNFDVESAEDRAFVDRVQEANETLLQMGFIKPTQMAAVMVKDKQATCIASRGLHPLFAVRDPLLERIPPGLIACRDMS